VTIEEVIARRQISEVLHFTTNRGLTGILASGRILSRARLGSDKYVEHVYEPNAQVRRDQVWLDYVNLSITRLNWEFFGHSRRWHAHEEIWWCAVAMSPEVLELDGVTFATTNNIYSGCSHAEGADGLEALFADRIVRWRGNVADRPTDFPLNWTTCHQAEVLVPEQVDVDYIRRIYVATERHADIASSQCEILLQASPDLPIVVSPDAFEPQTSP
jgi:hypothetical protein